jgi:predicted nucleotide-binding protein (sugar kinase/HSP70/actin superfamily)
MNSHIPEIIEKHGIRTFYMDMLPGWQGKSSVNEELIKAFRWKFATRIMEAAETILETDSSYPILLTSFKCTPDSFVIEYFKEIFEARGKPYLILQLDEHDSAVGYETRIEAGICTFLNHFHKQKAGFTGSPGVQKNRESFNLQFGKIQHLKNKTMLLPSCDPQVGPLLEAVLQNSGLDVRLLDSTNESIRRSLSHNTGQCLPLNIIVQNAIDYIETRKLEPSDTVLWVIKSTLSCNLSMFPQYTQKLLKDFGNGLEKTSVYSGDLMFYDISLQTAINAYLAYMFGGNIRKIGCMIRPYEKEIGRTNQVIGESFALLRDAFREGKPKEKILEYLIGEFKKIETVKADRTKVAIFGDLYVRDNDLMNQDLIKIIEENGGEVITTPYSDYIKIIVEPFTARAFKEGRYLDYARTKFLKSLIPIVEENYAPYFNRIFGEPKKEEKSEIDGWLNRFGINLLHRGESFENILKIHQLITHHPDIELFIQTNPSYCCPSLVTEAMAPRIEELTGIPVVTIEYDGTSGFKNEDIIPYMKFRKARHPAHIIS